MSGYIGVEPVPLATQVVYEEIFDAPFQVVEIPGGYTVDNIEVFVNGVFLHPNGYTAENGTTVDLGVTFNASNSTPFEFYIKEVRQYEDVNASDPTKLAIANNLQEIEDAGSAAQAEVRENINAVSEISGSKPLDGDFTSGTCYYNKIGKLVTITGTSSSGPDGYTGVSTSTGFIPDEYRPNELMQAIYYLDDIRIMDVRIFPSGKLAVEVRDPDGGLSPGAELWNRINISYLVY